MHLGVKTPSNTCDVELTKGNGMQYRVELVSSRSELTCDTDQELVGIGVHLGVKTPPALVIFLVCK